MAAALCAAGWKNIQVCLGPLEGKSRSRCEVYVL